MSETFYNLITQNITLGKLSATGYKSCKCPVCNDYKSRMGIKQENNKILINCFNCGLKTYHYENSKSMLPTFRKVLNAFLIDDSQIDLILSKNFFKTSFVKNNDKSEIKFILPQKIDLPPNSHLLNDDSSLWKNIALSFLELRGLSKDDYRWYISNDDKFCSKLIIPFFRQNDIFYWQAREMDPESNVRYVNPPVSKNNIIFNFDELTRYTQEPLFVTEGVFDAISMGQNAIAILGSTLNQFKIEMIKRVKDREIIFILDKDRNGKQLGEIAIKNDWKISFFDGELKDANDALQKMGKLWMLNNVLKNKKTDFDAKLCLQSFKN